MMPCVLVHGLGQNASSWNKIISLMLEHNKLYCPELFDLPECREVGYGGLFSAFTNYINAIPGRLNLCGISLGAILSLNYAIEHPEKVQSMVLIAAQYRIPKLLLSLQNIIFHLLPESFFTSKGQGKRQTIELVDSMSTLDFSARLDSLTCSVLVVRGEKDTANKKASRELTKNLSKVEFQIVAGVGHEINTEAPEELASILNIYLNGGGVDP